MTKDEAVDDLLEHVRDYIALNGHELLTPGKLDEFADIFSDCLANIKRADGY
jgi:hypothetical protein